MSGMVKNFIARVSVSAVVGAIVAGGIVWFSNESVSRNVNGTLLNETTALGTSVSDLTAKLDTITEAQSGLADALTALNARITALEDANTEILDEIATDADAIFEKIDAETAALSAKVDAMSEPFDDRAILESMAMIDISVDDLKAEIEAVKAQLAQSPEPAEVPDFDDILDKMIGAVERLEQFTAAEGTE